MCRVNLTKIPLTYLQWQRSNLSSCDILKLLGLGQDDLAVSSPFLDAKFEHPEFNFELDFKDPALLAELDRLAALPDFADKVAYTTNPVGNEAPFDNVNLDAMSRVFVLHHPNVLLAYQCTLKEGYENVTCFFVFIETLLELFQDAYKKKILQKNFDMVVDGHGADLYVAENGDEPPIYE